MTGLGQVGAPRKASRHLAKLVLSFCMLQLQTSVTDKASDFSNMAKSHTRRTGPILLAYIIMVIQCAICYTLTWYLSHVRPGKYGQALPWNFCFKVSMCPLHAVVSYKLKSTLM